MIQLAAINVCVPLLSGYQKTFRYLRRFYSLLFRGFFVVFSWLFRGSLLSRKTVFGPFSWLFRGFFVAPVLGKIYAYSPWNSLLRLDVLVGWGCDVLVCCEVRATCAGAENLSQGGLAFGVSLLSGPPGPF